MRIFLVYPFSPKICQNVHIKITASSNFKQIPIYLEINTLGKLLPTSYIRTFVLCSAKRRQGVGRICSLSISEQESRLTCASRISFVFCFLFVVFFAELPSGKSDNFKTNVTTVKVSHESHSNAELLQNCTIIE